jgi:hypothetical protein
MTFLTGESKFSLMKIELTSSNEGKSHANVPQLPLFFSLPRNFHRLKVTQTQAIIINLIKMREKNLINMFHNVHGTTGKEFCS